MSYEIEYYIMCSMLVVGHVHIHIRLYKTKKEEEAEHER